MSFSIKADRGLLRLSRVSFSSSAVLDVENDEQVISEVVTNVEKYLNKLLNMTIKSTNANISIGLRTQKSTTFISSCNSIILMFTGSYTMIVHL